MRLAIAVFLALTVTAGAAQAVSPVTVVFGTSWDGPTNDLQHIVDAVYGPGIHVNTDYIGAHPFQPDPFYWSDAGFSSLLVKEVAGNRDRNTVGWYLETGVMPASLLNDNIHDGVVFDGPANPGATKSVNFSGAHTHFGFYMNPNGTGNATNAPEPELFFTNRFFNDKGPNGVAVHAPFDGDVQALVFDISVIKHQPNTWLVCFEDLDSGPNPTSCCSQTDNDFNDLVFEVHAIGITPVIHMTYTDLRKKYK